MTREQESRVVRAIAETNNNLERAMRYSPDLQDTKLIAFYENHLEHLTEMLKTGAVPSIRFRTPNQTASATSSN